MKDKAINKAIIVFLVFIILISGWLYGDSFGAYFFQDDWFTLRISRAQNIQDFLGLFIPRKDVIYFRPLGMQVPFFILSSIFGINPLPFHLLICLTHGINIILVYLTINQLSKNKIIATCSAFLFGTSTMHYIPFYWPSTYAFPLGISFCLISFLQYLKYSKTNRNIYLYRSLGAQFLALLTSELALLLPLVIVAYMFIWHKVNKKYLIPALIFTTAYLILRLIFLPDLVDTYTVEFGKKTLKVLFVYCLWLFNWPEEIRNQLENILRGNISYIKSFGNIFILEVILFATSILIIIISFFRHPVSKESNKLIRFFIILSLLGIALPVLFPNHTYPYYLLFSSLGMYPLLALAIYWLLLQKISSKGLFLLLIYFGIWLVNSHHTIQFQNNNHWSTQRAKISKMVTSDILSRFSNLSSSSIIYLYNDPLLKIVLSGDEAFKVLYNNLSIDTIYYGKEDILWKDAPSDIIIIKERLKWNYAK